MKSRYVLTFFMAICITSAVWFLAISDGTIDTITNHYYQKQEKENLIAEEHRLRLEVSILKNRMQKKVLRAWLKKVKQLEHTQAF